MKGENHGLTILTTTKGKLPSLSFVVMKNEILGKNYELTIISVTKKTSRHLNNTYRQKDYPTNILSFPISKKYGELVLHVPSIKKDAKKFNMDTDNFFGFLVIHGMLHLKGMEHGSTMERQEKKWCKKFNIQEQH